VVARTFAAVGGTARLGGRGVGLGEFLDLDHTGTSMHLVLRMMLQFAGHAGGMVGRAAASGH
jgi:hypothetical protein